MLKICLVDCWSEAVEEMRWKWMIWYEQWDEQIQNAIKWVSWLLDSSSQHQQSAAALNIINVWSGMTSEGDKMHMYWSLCLRLVTVLISYFERSQKEKVCNWIIHTKRPIFTQSPITKKNLYKNFFVEFLQLSEFCNNI